MTTYPISATVVPLKHQGGTKFYHLTLIKTADGKGALLRRFGKVTVFGELIQQTWPTFAEAEKEFEKIFREKTSGRKGYAPNGIAKETIAADQAGLQDLFGRMLWPKLSADFITHLDASIPTAGRREPDAPRFSEDGEFIEQKQRTLSPQEIEAARELERQQNAEVAKSAYAANPKFGTW
jgi:predicted DNA-binding WGR domain protein